MNTITHLSPSWQAWLADNLARGCSTASLAERMVQSGFDPVFADNAVQQGRVAAQTGAAVPASPASGYMYETPRLPQTGNVLAAHDRDVRVTLRLRQPVLAVFDNLMTTSECDELVELSRIKLTRSAIVDPATGESRVIDNRSSYGTFFHLNENDFIARLDRRIADLMHWPVENGEGIQILHYPAGGEYKAHFDYFPVENPGSSVHLDKGGQRVSTLVMYLNDVAEGGETTFPSIHLTVSPKKGSAVYFEYCNSRGQVDPLSLHAGQPVLQGEKWIATKWMRERKYG